MKFKNYIGSTVLLLVSACTGSNKQAFTPPASMTPTESMGLIANRFGTLVDAREKSALKAGMAQPAISIPLSEIQQNSETAKKALNAIRKDQQIITYCDDTECGKQAAAKFQELGFKASYLTGFQEWREANLPVKPSQ
jgi:rhodanese-related sulfurtransferase